jgi:AraC family transcriptional regulator, transcriptional activator of pobA
LTIKAGTKGESEGVGMSITSIAMQKTLQVPAFFLFGEPYRPDVYAFIHAEKLEARNAGIGWKIPLHVHPDFDQLSIMFSGQCEYEHDGVITRIEAPSCVCTKAGSVHRFTYQPGSDGIVISVSPDIIDGFGSTASAISRAYLRLTSARMFAFAEPHACQAIHQLCNMLCYHVAAHHENRLDVLRHVFVALLFELEVFAAKEKVQQNQKSDLGSVQLFESYQELIRKEIGEIGFEQNKQSIIPTVSYFAEKLATTSHLLNTCCKLITDTGARDLLQDAMAYQASRLLLYTELSVKEISYLLGYSHASHFVRFFKQKRKVTPNEFRNNRDKVWL